MKLRPITTCIAMLAIAVIAPACAGGEDDATAESGLASSSLNKAEYVKQVNSLCTKRIDDMMNALLRYGETHPKGSAEDTAKTAVLKVVPGAMMRQAEKIRALGAPSGGEARIEAYLGAMENSVARVEAQRPGDVFELQKALLPVNKPAAAYGLVGCEY